MKVGSLFSGIGGFDLGLERAGFEIAWQVENNDYCREVLRKHWPAVPCHYDIKAIDWHYIQQVDLICGGFPCQPFSCAGKRRGAADDRYLWPEVVRCLSELKPTWFLGENVPGLIHLGFEQVCLDLEALGYETTTLVIPACAVDAPHIRKRLWILAYTESDLRRASGDDGPEALNGSGSPMADAKSEQVERQGSGGFQPQLTQCGKAVAYTFSEQSERGSNGSERWKRGTRQAACDGGQGRGFENGRWPTEPAVGRVAHGVPARVDRLRGLGNAVVPQIVEAIGRMILEVEHANLHWLQRDKTVE